MKELILNNKNVLVVDDNSINQLIVKHSLAKLGATTAQATDGLEAIEKLQANNFDLVLMDIQMPGMDGYETTRFIRNQLKSNIPIIAMTAFALQGEDEKCLECGMNGYVAKPFTIETLAASIVNVVASEKEMVKDPNTLSSGKVTVDISMLYEISGDDKSYIGLMVHTFVENMPETVRKMENYLQQKDYDNLYKMAHYAKSSLSVIKVSDARELVEKIELLAKQRKDVETIPLLLREVKEKTEEAEQLLLVEFGTTV